MEGGELGPSFAGVTFEKRDEQCRSFMTSSDVGRPPPSRGPVSDVRVGVTVLRLPRGLDSSRSDWTSRRPTSSPSSGVSGVDGGRRGSPTRPPSFLIHN